MTLTKIIGLKIVLKSLLTTNTSCKSKQLRLVEEGEVHQTPWAEGSENTASGEKHNRFNHAKETGYKIQKNVKGKGLIYLPLHPARLGVSIASYNLTFSVFFSAPKS